MSVVAPFNSVAAIGYRVLLIRVDLPDPDTPVTQVSSPSGDYKPINQHDQVWEFEPGIELGPDMSLS